MSQGIIVMGRRIRFRFLFFLTFIIIVIFLLIRLVSKQPLYDTIQYGEITTWEECTGLIVRDEKVYNAPDYGKVDYFVSNGELIDQGVLIAMLYKNNYSQELVNDLYQTKQKISDYQYKNIVKDMMDKDFNVIAQNIEEIIKSIQYKNNEGDTKDLQREEKELRGLLYRRKALLDKKDLPDNYLEKLYEQERSIEEKLEQWKIEIKAQDTGVISMKLDGLEEILTPNVLESLTMDEYVTFIEHLNEPLDNKENEFGTPLFKMVIPNKWYILSLIPHEEVFYEEGDYIKVKLSGLSKEDVGATIHRIEYVKNHTLVILEMTESIEEVFEERNIQGELGTTVQGLMVPNSSIMETKDDVCIRLTKRGKVELVPIKIKAKNDEWTIIEKKRTTDNLELNDSVLIN